MSRPELIAPPEVVCISFRSFFVTVYSHSLLSLTSLSFTVKRKQKNILESFFFSDHSSSTIDYVSTRIIYIQRKLTSRAVELLNLPPGRPAIILDIGCGSGLSGQVLEEMNHIQWIGLDISSAMLRMSTITLSLSVFHIS